MGDLISLPNDVLFDILAKLDYSTLARLCSTSSNFNTVCISSAFWTHKYTQDFKQPFPLNPSEPGKTVYFREAIRRLNQNYTNLQTQLLNTIHGIFIDANAKMDPVFRDMRPEFVNLISKGFKVEILQEALADKRDYVNKHSLFLETLLEHIADSINENDITTVNGVNIIDGFGVVNERLIMPFTKEIIQAMLEFTIKSNGIVLDINTLFNLLSKTKSLYHYITPEGNYGEMYINDFNRMLTDIKFGNQRGKSKFSYFVSHPEPLQDYDTYSTLPNLPIPQRAPQILNIEEPEPLPFDFPPPSHGPAPPGSTIKLLPPSPIRIEHGRIIKVPQVKNNPQLQYKNLYAPQLKSQNLKKLQPRTQRK